MNLKKIINVILLLSAIVLHSPFLVHSFYVMKGYNILIMIPLWFFIVRFHRNRFGGIISQFLIVFISSSTIMAINIWHTEVRGWLFVFMLGILYNILKYLVSAYILSTIYDHLIRKRLSASGNG